MNPFDAGMLGIVGFQVLVGCLRGFVRKAMDILILAVSCGMAYWYARRGEGLLFVTVMFTLTTIVLQSLYWFWRKAIVRSQSKLSWPARLGGSFLGLAVGALYAILIVLGLRSFPALVAAVPGAREMLRRSVMYQICRQQPEASDTPTAESEPAQDETAVDVTQINAAAANLKLAPEAVEALRSRPTVQAVLEDEALLGMISEQNYAQMMAHPKFRALLNDPELLRLVLQAGMLDPFAASGE